MARKPADLVRMEQAAMADKGLLSPCPFCGGNQFRAEIRGKIWGGMSWIYHVSPRATSLIHWCESVPGQPQGMIKIYAGDYYQCLKIWNSQDIDRMTFC